MQQAKNLLDQKEVRARLGKICRSTLYKLVKSGVLDHPVRLPGCARSFWTPDAVDRAYAKAVEGDAK